MTIDLAALLATINRRERIAFHPVGRFAAGEQRATPVGEVRSPTGATALLRWSMAPDASQRNATTASSMAQL